jgi:hypothetical protein
MSDKVDVALEEVLAAVIDEIGGRLVVPMDALKKDRAGKAIAIDFDDEKQAVVFTLQEQEDIIYEE